MNNEPDDNTNRRDNLSEANSNRAPHDADSLIRAYLQAVPGITNTLQQTKETLLRAASLKSAITDSIVPSLVKIGETLASYYKAIDWNAYSFIYEDLSWESLRSGAMTWGDYGWVISRLAPGEIRTAPKSLEEADEYYSQYLTRNNIEAIFDTTEKRIARKKDYRECVALYEKGHFKSCAMMTCSLIEGQLLKTGLANSKKRRNGKVVLEKAKELDGSALDALCIENLLGAYLYFYKSANNFDRTLEGELNRNFLMHGMMYKPVRRKTCIKLFLLLETIVTLLPEAISCMKQNH